MKYSKERTKEQIVFIILRTQHNLTIEDVSRKTGVSRKTIYRFERGEFKRDTDKIVKLKKFYLELSKGVGEYE